MQAQIFEAFTRQLFHEAGLGSGMHVSMWAAEVAMWHFSRPNWLEVIGVDRTPAAISLARTRAESKRISNVQFVEGDPTQLKFDNDFDVRCPG
jgi:ubiquinone/menaquinone biosynthesis C-methylase UbiE